MELLISMDAVYKAVFHYSQNFNYKYTVVRDRVLTNNTTFWTGKKWPEWKGDLISQTNFLYFNWK